MTSTGESFGCTREKSLRRRLGLAQSTGPQIEIGKIKLKNRELRVQSDSRLQPLDRLWELPLSRQHGHQDRRRGDVVRRCLGREARLSLSLIEFLLRECQLRQTEKRRNILAVGLDGSAKCLCSLSRILLPHVRRSQEAVHLGALRIYRQSRLCGLNGAIPLLPSQKGLDEASVGFQAFRIGLHRRTVFPFRRLRLPLQIKHASLVEARGERTGVDCEAARERIERLVILFQRSIRGPDEVVRSHIRGIGRQGRLGLPQRLRGLSQTEERAGEFEVQVRHVGCLLAGFLQQLQRLLGLPSPRQGLREAKLNQRAVWREFERSPQGAFRGFHLSRRQVRLAEQIVPLGNLRELSRERVQHPDRLFGLAVAIVEAGQGNSPARVNNSPLGNGLKRGDGVVKFAL